MNKWTVYMEGRTRYAVTVLAETEAGALAAAEEHEGDLIQEHSLDSLRVTQVKCDGPTDQRYWTPTIELDCGFSFEAESLMAASEAEAIEAAGWLWGNVYYDKSWLDDTIEELAPGIELPRDLPMVAEVARIAARLADTPEQQQQRQQTLRSKFGVF